MENDPGAQRNSVRGWTGNIRDIGGIAVNDGKRVKRGLIFRSAELYDLSEEDCRDLECLNILAIYDLRSTLERDRRPSQAGRFGSAIISTRDYVDSAAGFPKIVALRPTGEDLSIEAMQDLYRSIPYEHAPSIKRIFELIGDGNLPILFHCVAGKDRTGIVSALLLESLGCSREDIFLDYLMTNMSTDHIRSRFLEHASREVSDLAWEPVVRSDIRYLQAMFDQLDADHRGVEGYLASIGILGEDLTGIRQILLEPDN